MNLDELLKQRSELQAKLVSIVEKAEGESRELNKDEDKEYKDTLTKVKALTNRIDRIREVNDLGAAAANDQQQLTEPQGQAYASAPADHIQRGNSNAENRDLRNYSFRKAFLASRQLGKLEGLEKEMHQQGENEIIAIGTSPNDGVHIPEAVMWAGSRINGGQGQMNAYRNDMTKAATQGGDTIATDLRAPIDVLYDALVLTSLGVTTWFGMQGNLSVPVMGSTAKPTEKSETGAADEVTGTTSAVPLAPERLPVVTEATSQLLRQSSINIESWLRNNLFTNMAIRMQDMAINGSGSSNQPTGLLQTGGLTLVALGTDGAAPTRTMLTRQLGKVDIANALMGNLGWLTNGKVRTTLQETKKDAGSGQFVWNEETPNQLMGYTAAVTNSVPSNLVKGGSGSVCSAHIFGNFSDLVIAQWGGMTLLSDNITKFDTGLIRIGAETFYNSLVTRAASFAATKDALTTI